MGSSDWRKPVERPTTHMGYDEVGIKQSYDKGSGKTWDPVDLPNMEGSPWVIKQIYRCNLPHSRA